MKARVIIRRYVLRPPAKSCQEQNKEEYFSKHNNLSLQLISDKYIYKFNIKKIKTNNLIQHLRYDVFEILYMRCHHRVPER